MAKRDTKLKSRESVLILQSQITFNFEEANNVGDGSIESEEDDHEEKEE